MIHNGNYLLEVPVDLAFILIQQLLFLVLCTQPYKVSMEGISMTLSQTPAALVLLCQPSHTPSVPAAADSIRAGSRKAAKMYCNRLT